VAGAADPRAAGRCVVIARDTYPAQIVFVESDRGHCWTGRLLRPASCVDAARHGRPVTWTPYVDIHEDALTGRCTVAMNGGSTLHSQRYASYPDVTAAQQAGVRWAARRFRVPSHLPGVSR
jgi:hypothetical protein